MNTLIHADIFFFITSVFVVILTFFLIICGMYLVQTLKNFRDISDTLKRGVDNIEDHVEDAYEDVTESRVFQFLFGKKKKAGKKPEPHHHDHSHR